MTAPATGPRILYTVPPPSSESNPYTTLLANGVAKQLPVAFFSWRRALMGTHDVLHVHWPETLVRSHSPARRALRLAAGHVYLTLARTRGVKVVRTVHNREPHESGAAMERWFLRRLERATDARILLSHADRDDDPSARVILHGHYRDWPEYRVERSAKQRVLLLFGALRRYKGIEDAIAAFKLLSQDSRAALHIAGKPVDVVYEQFLKDAATGDDRISLEAKRLPSATLATLVSSAAAVVLPYRDFYNSGAALLALSLGTHILAPRTPSSTLLLQEFGPQWVTLYDGPLTAGVIAGALDAGMSVPSEGPDMRTRAWAPIVAEHVALYRELTGPL